jgi:hypothetical protein
MSAGPGQGTAPAGDAGQQQGAENGGQQGNGDGGQDLAALLAQQQASQQEMFDYLRTEPWKAEEPEAQQQEPEPLDLSFLDMDDPAYDPNTVADRLGSLIDQTVSQRLEQGIQQAVGPIQEQVQQQQRQQEVAALVGEFPELGEKETGEAVLRMAGQLAEAHGHPELANEPWLWRMTYLAGRAVDAAQEEQGDVPAPAHLEGGAGAVPGGEGADLGDAIVGAGRKGRGALPFG